VFAVGETVMLVPDPMEVPPQLPAYHRQVAPVPREPPLRVRVVEVPGQIELSPLIELAAEDSV